jgi:N-methylhydantoinase A
MPPLSQIRIAIDIGGTFTNRVVVDDRTAVIASSKTLTIHANPAEGALQGARRALGTAGVAMGDVVGFIHGTTLATNALIEKRGAAVATITTEGFRDILEIA